MKNLVAMIALSATPAWAMDAKLIGGRLGDPLEFPASLYVSISGSKCTGTLIGEQTLILAAHCVADGGNATFSIQDKKYSSKCKRSPSYSSNNTADWAICKVDRIVQDVVFENVNINANLHSVKQELLLTGYGCIVGGGGGGNDSRYRIGESRISKLPANSSNDIITKGGGALCFGDSGGPAFLYLDAEKKYRVLAAINSRGDIRTTSYLSSISTAPAQKFLRDWSTANSQHICGMHAEAIGCRDLGPDFK